MPKARPWQDKATLYELYVRKGLTIDKIAKLFTDEGYPCTPMTIFNHLKKNNLLTNSRNLGKRSVGNNSKRKGGYYG